jgi:cytochrome c biogenesis protein CcdA
MLDLAAFIAAFSIVFYIVLWLALDLAHGLRHQQRHIRLLLFAFCLATGLWFYTALIQQSRDGEVDEMRDELTRTHKNEIHQLQDKQLEAIGKTFDEMDSRVRLQCSSFMNKRALSDFEREVCQGDVWDRRSVVAAVSVSLGR